MKKVQAAYQLLGDPLKKIKVIHIAGTNGKGSVCNMVFSILKESGKKVGIFSSPHLVDIKERFRSYDSYITEEEFIHFVNRILDLPFTLSYFEKCTLIAFLFFESKKLEYAVVEVGFGGLLDSTNIVDPICTAITSISFDHMEYLGDTLEKISYQKAGIIKETIPIIINHKNQVIEQIAKDKNAPLIRTEREIQTNLLGKHQQKNAAIAFEIGKKISLKEDDILRGLQKVEHMGRIQYIYSNLLIDGAHNEESFSSLKQYIDSVSHKFKKIQYCLALKKGKDIGTLLSTFGNTSTYTLIDSQHIMIEKVSNIQNQLEKYGVDSEVSSSDDIIQKAHTEIDTLFVVFGSLYMIGEFLSENYLLPEQVIIGIGANIGEREETLNLACDEMRMLGKNFRASSYVQTEPWGGVATKPFLNGVCVFETSLSPHDLLRELQKIETRLGRVRNKKWGNRVIDLDILYYGDRHINTKDLVVPHPYIEQRDFVLKPLKELLPNFEI